MSVSKCKKTGKWQARYYDVNQKQRSKRFVRKVDAEIWEAEQKAKVRRGDWTDPAAGKVTVQSVYTDWIESHRMTERTRFGYREVWRNCIQPTWGDRRLDQVQATEITRWLTAMGDAGLSRSRVNKAATVLNQVLRWAVADQRLASNPMDRAKALSKTSLLPKKPAKQGNRYLTAREVRLLASAATSVRAEAKAKHKNPTPDLVTADYELMILTMAFTGLRFGEVTALRGRDLDVLKRRVLVRQANTDVGGRLDEVTPKSGKSRDVPIPAELLERLVPLLETAGPDGLLFTAPLGGPVRYSNWRSTSFNKAVKTAGLVNVTPHDLRHTFASLWQRAGFSIKALQMALGHATITLTMDTYGGLFESDMDEFGARFAESIAEPPETADVDSGEAESRTNEAKSRPQAVDVVSLDAVRAAQ